MPATWQCDDCGTSYRVAWLSHCYRREGDGRPPKPPARVAKPSRRKRMPRIVTGVGPSNARAELEQPSVVEDVTEAEFDAMLAEGTPVEVVTEPVAAVVEPEPAPVAEEAAPAPVEDPAPAAAPAKDAPKGSAA